MIVNVLCSNGGCCVVVASTLVFADIGRCFCIDGNFSLPFLFSVSGPNGSNFVDVSFTPDGDALLLFLCFLIAFTGSINPPLTLSVDADMPSMLCFGVDVPLVLDVEVLLAFILFFIFAFYVGSINRRQCVCML
jgi:hypothetical protein